MGTQAKDMSRWFPSEEIKSLMCEKKFIPVINRINANQSNSMIPFHAS